MIAARRRSLERKLASFPVPPRPSGLAEAIKREIPAGLRLPAPTTPSPEPRQQWRLAAALFATIAGGFLGYRVLHDFWPTGDAARPAAPAPATSPRTLKLDAHVLPMPSTSRPDLAPTAADVRVRVVDPEGRPLAGARVTFRGAGGPRVAVTDRAGVARFRSMGTGRYVLRGELEGFTTFEERGVRIARGPRVAVELTLLASVEDQLTVTTESPSYTTSTASAAVSVNGPLDPLGPASTGGTAEPNDQPYGDMFFSYHGVNPFVDTEDDRLSTFGLDVDTGSYGVASGYLREGHLPPAEAIRVEEFINAFRYGDPPAASSGPEPLTLHVEGAPSPFAGGERYRLLRFHLQARTVDPADRLPAILTFVVDVSGSMEGEERLGLVKRALFLLIDQLRPTDQVGLVVYGSAGRVLLPHTADHERLRAAVAALETEGATNAEEGLRLGYDLAAQARRAGSINRVILCSDGVANVGETGADSILARIGEEARRGIELTTVGFGMGNYNDVLMEKLADTGNGRYAYVDDLRAARRIFVDDLTGTLQTVAADAKAQVEFDPRLVERWRLLGYENRDIADEEFRDDRVDAGEVGAGQEVTALYEVKLKRRPSRRGVVATLRLRYRPVGADGPGAVVETTHVLRGRDLAPSWEEASRGLRLAAVVAELAELLKQSYWARGSTLGEVARLAAAAAADFPGDDRVAELAELSARAAELATEARESPEHE